MGARFDIRSYSTAEIVLLGIFALGLLWASAVVSYRNKIRLSEPIELKLGGVSVSLPVEGGWQGSQTWAYNRQEDMFALTGRLLVGGKVGAVVQWRFMVVSGSVMPEDLLLERAGADEVEVEIVDAGRIQADVEMDWVHGRLLGRLQDIFLGTARIGGSRVVELEVVTPGDEELAGRVFRAVAASLKFVQPDLSQRPMASRLRRVGVALFGENNIDDEGAGG